MLSDYIFQVRSFVQIYVNKKHFLRENIVEEVHILTAGNWELFHIVSPVFCLFLKHFLLYF